MKFSIKKPTNALCLTLWVAIYFALIFNARFILDSYAYFKAEGFTMINVIYSLSIPFFLMAVFISLFSLIVIRYLEKPVLIFLVLISSLLSYGNWYYGLRFDDFSPMILAIEQTNMAEVTPYLTPSLLAWFLLFGLYPSFIIFKVPIYRYSFLKEQTIKILGLSIYPIFYFIIILPSLPIYHPLLRLSGLAARLPYQMTPNNFFENFFNQTLDQLRSFVPYQKIGLDARRAHVENNKKNLLVIVIGETARSMNFELNGYERTTNRYTKQQHVISFQDVSSCGTATTVSVPCIFSSLSRHRFVTSIAAYQDNLLDILKRTDVDILWIDNNGPGDCQGVCKRVKGLMSHGSDEALVQLFFEELTKPSLKDKVIVLHMLGSHGPDYYAKYPDAFRVFTPDCRKNELRFCDPDTLTNAYDNSILYTDYLLSRVIERLKTQMNFQNTALIYTSDHGESIGERGLYGHCAPYILAPAEQTKVPLMVWMSEGFQAEKKLTWSCLHEQATHKSYSHDYLFHSILGLMDVQTEVYQSNLDLFKMCRA